MCSDAKKLFDWNVLFVAIMGHLLQISTIHAIRFSGLKGRRVDARQIGGLMENRTTGVWNAAIIQSRRSSCRLTLRGVGEVGEDVGQGNVTTFRLGLYGKTAKKSK